MVLTSNPMPIPQALFVVTRSALAPYRARIGIILGLTVVVWAVLMWTRFPHLDSTLARRSPEACVLGNNAACSSTSSGVIAAPNGITGKPRLVEFFGTACPACRRMAPRLTELKSRCGLADDALLQIPIDEDPGQALAVRYKVEAIPTFLTVDSNGVEVARQVGEQSDQTLDRMAIEVAGRRCKAL